MHLVKLIPLLLILGLSQISLARSLANRPRLTDGTVLTRGLWMFGYDRGQATPLSNLYDSTGNSKTAQEYYARSLKVSELLENIENSEEQSLAAAAFSAQGLDPSEAAGIVVTDLEVKTASEAFVLGYGVTDSLSILFVAPKVSLQFKTNSELQFSQNFKKLISDLRAQGQNSRADEIERTGKTVLAAQLRKYNYQPGYISEWQGIPDFYFTARFATEKMKTLGLTFDTQISIPNESNIYNDQFIPLDFFEETASIMPALLYKKRFNNTALDLSTSYQFRNSFKKETRVPLNSDSPFSEDKETLTIKYGDEWTNSAQISQRLGIATPFLNLTLTQKMSDRYNGSQFSQERYKHLEKDSFQRMLSSTLGLQLNLVDSFLQKRFPFPGIFTFTFSDVVAGNNVFRSQNYGINFLVFYK